MFAQFTRKSLATTARTFSTSSQQNTKVAVLGAAGGIGQPLSLLLKCNTSISRLGVYDVANTPGVAADLSHINTPASLVHGKGDAELDKVLKDAEIVVIPAGVPRKPGQTRDDLFNTNAGIVRTLVEACAKNCPKALIAIITNPVNSTVPIAAEVLKKKGCYDPKRVFGVTTLDLVRSSTFIAEYIGANPIDLNIPVIGGHSGVTIIPITSQASQKVTFKSKEDLDKLTDRIQNAGTEVVKAKAGGGSATLSMAFAAARFTNSLIKGLHGEKNVVECAYVENEVCGVKYFSTPIVLGKGGVEKNLGLGDLNDYEKGLLEKAIPELKKDIQKGEEFAKKG